MLNEELNREILPQSPYGEGGAGHLTKMYRIKISETYRRMQLLQLGYLAGYLGEHTAEVFLNNTFFANLI